MIDEYIKITSCRYTADAPFFPFFSSISILCSRIVDKTGSKKKSFSKTEWWWTGKTAPIENSIKIAYAWRRRQRRCDDDGSSYNHIKWTENAIIRVATLQFRLFIELATLIVRRLEVFVLCPLHIAAAHHLNGFAHHFNFKCKSTLANLSPKVAQVNQSNKLPSTTSSSSSSSLPPGEWLKIHIFVKQIDRMRSKWPNPTINTISNWMWILNWKWTRVNEHLISASVAHWVCAHRSIHRRTHFCESRLPKNILFFIWVDIERKYDLFAPRKKPTKSK